MNAAIITGASMGLGEEFARQLAASGENLVLVARSGARLEALAGELAAAHGVRVFTFACDLAQAGAAGRVADFIERQGLSPTWLVNNAGLGEAGAFDALEPGRVDALLMVNVVALTGLTRLLLPALRRAGAGWILNVASRAAFQPVPWFGLYAASKAYVLSFSEALHEELRGTGVRVTCLCPGPTATDFNRNNRIRLRAAQNALSAATVARRGIEGCRRGEAVIIGQGFWTILAQRFLSRAFVRRTAGEVTRKGKKVE